MGREISNKDFQISENLPNTFLKAEQFFTFADLVCDGAETEGFATPSRNSIAIPASLISPTSENNQLLQTADEIQYIQLAQRDIFLDGRAIRDLAGAENITKTSMAIRVGKDNQPIMAGVNEFRASGNLSPAKVLNNNNPEGNKVTGTVDKGTGINDTPRAVIVTLTWQSLRQLGADDGASVALGIQPNATFPNGLSGNVDIVIRLRGNNGQEIGRRVVAVNGVSVGQYSADYRVDIPLFAFITEAARNLYYPISVDVLRTDLEFREVGGLHPFSDSGRNLYEEGSRRFTEFFFAKLQSVHPQIASITEFPKSSYIGIRYSAEQFPNIPQRKYLYRGIKIKVPTGVTIDVANTGRIIYPAGYTFGALDSTKKWTNDPAWILYALLTEDYGLNLDESTIDKASFYEASLYCSNFANTGEPRYSFNGVLNVRKKALDVIKEVAGIMRATLYYKNGNLKIALDKKETDTSYLFTNANVVDGQFNYVGSDKDKKFSQINVAYYNNDLQEMDQVSVLDTTVETKYGINQQNVRAMYTTDKNQAIRFGRAILYSSNFESEIVSFECGLEAACKLEPLMVIKIADRLKEIIRASGRIKSVTSTTVFVLDDSTNTSVGFVNDTFLIVDTSGNVQERTITAVNGSTVTLSSALSANAGTVWAVKTGNVQHRKFRISNIKQKNDFVFSITAATYDDNKFAFIDGAVGSFGVGEAPSTLLDVLPAPIIHSLKEETIVVNKRATSRIVLNFGHVAGARQYQVSYRLEDGDPVVQNVKDNQFVIPNNVAGLYKFSVRTINSAFQVSTTVGAQNLQALGLSTPPSNVVNLRFEESGDDLILKWDKADPLTDIDVLFGGLVIIQFAAVTDGSAEYGNSSLIREISGDSNEITISNFLSGEYFVKFKDVAGNESPSATSVVVNRLVTSPNLKAQEIRESTNNFAGAKTNLIYDSSIAGLTLSAAITFDSLTDFNTLAISGGTTFASLNLVGGTGSGGIPKTGNYTFQNTIDLGAVFRFRVETVEKKRGYNTVTLFDSYTDKMDTWPDIFTGSTVQFSKTADLTFQVAKSSTSTASTSFATFTNTDMTTRTVAFKVLVNNNSGYENVDIEELGVNLIFRPRTERSIDNTSATNGILSSSSSGATTVAFAKKFFLGTSAVGGGTEKFKPVIAININNMQSGDFFTIDSVTTSNFVVSIKNGTSFVARQFTYSAFGYGEG